MGKKEVVTRTDEELLRLYRETGNSAWFGELYNRYIPLLFGVSMKYLKDEDKAQDAVMQLFENLLLKVNDQDIQRFRTWLYSVVKNHCLQILRKENREIVVDLGADLMESDLVMHLFNEEEEEDERKEALKQCIDLLPQQQQISIRCFFMEEMSYADITEQTGFSLSRVKSYIQNGKRNLKNCIEKKLK